METDSRSVVVRRFVAIGLVILTIVFLFWPSIIRVNGRSDAFDSYTKQMTQLGRNLYGKHFADEWQYRESRYHDRQVTAEEYLEAEETGRQFYDFLMDENFNHSFAHLCRFFPKLLKCADIDASIPIVVAAAMYFLFFANLLFAFASIPMMLFNKSRVFNVLLVVFAFQAGAVFLLLGLCGPIATMNDSSIRIAPVMPGYASVLLPAFALAACIVYKRPRPEKEVPAAAPVYPQQPANGGYGPEPVCSGWQQPPQPTYSGYAQNNWQQDNGYAQNNWQQGSGYAQNEWRQPAEAPQESAEAFWTCPVCGNKNAASARFCRNCGTQRQ